MKTTVTFDGVELTSMFVVSDLRRPLAPRNVALVDVSGRDGALFANATQATVSVSMALAVRSRDLRERSAAVRALAALLTTSEPRPLAIGDDDGLYYMAVANADQDGERFVNAERFEVTFTCPDPWLYGEVRTATVPSGGSVEVEVGGTAPTWPTITAAATGGTQDSWIVALDGGPAIYAAIPSGTEQEVIADCSARTLMVNGEAAMLPPAYDWPELTPGAHTLSMQQGTGEATVTWQERWW